MGSPKTPLIFIKYGCEEICLECCFNDLYRQRIMPERKCPFSGKIIDYDTTLQTLKRLYQVNEMEKELEALAVLE